MEMNFNEIDEMNNKCDVILKWALTRKNFDTSFVEGVKNSIEQYDNFTERQAAAVDNIITKFKIKCNL